MGNVRHPAKHPDHGFQTGRGLVPLHSGFDGLSVSGIERGQVGAVHLDGDAPSCAGVA